MHCPKYRVSIYDFFGSGGGRNQLRIKVVIATKDVVYLEKIGKRLNELYRSKLSVSTFSEIGDAIRYANDLKADVLLIDEEMQQSLGELPKRCSYALLDDREGIRSIDDVSVVSKYQSVQDIYTDIVNIFLNQVEANNVQFKNNAHSTNTIVTFFPAAGGVGTSTIASAYCMHVAAKGQKVLYLNLEEFGTSDVFFAGEGKGDFGDVLYAIEMDNTVTRMRIENAARKSETGVYFFAAAPSAIDMEDLTEDRLGRLFEVLEESSVFEKIVVDMPFMLQKKCLEQMRRSNAIVFVSDGSTNANIKLKRISDAVEKLSKQNNELLDCAALLMYNRFSSKNGHKLINSIFTEIGGIGRIENASPSELAKIISANNAFDSI